MYESEKPPWVVGIQNNLDKLILCLGCQASLFLPVFMYMYIYMLNSRKPLKADLGH